MSIQGDPKKYVKLIKAEKNVNDITFEERKQKDQEKQKSKPKNLRSHSKSPSGKSYLNTKSLKEEISILLSLAKSAKQKINKGLEFVKLIDNFNSDQRCLEHNNVITLYCMHDKKLLCVYCIYGVNKHRSHKLLPPFEHLDFIAKDVYELQQKFNEFLFSLEDVVMSSKNTHQLFQNIMKKYLGEIQVEYVKRKLELEQMYESQKKYVTKVCEELIENSKLISNEYEEIKFNIWECQARYNLDKRLKIGNQNPKEASYLQKQTNQKNMKAKENKVGEKNGKSGSKILNKSELLETNSKEMRKEEMGIRNEGMEENDKDYREVLSKHIILNHVVEEMRKIEPIKMDERAIERKMFNRSMLRLIPHMLNEGEKSPLKKSQTSVSIGKKK